MKLTFVIPWYGADVSGGAETEARKTAEALQRIAGFDVEVLTTCVRDFHSDWGVNTEPEGIEWVNGIPVRRFPVRARDTQAFDTVNVRLMQQLPVTADEEAIFMREMIHSPALYDFIRHNGDGRVFLFIPYMFGTTYEGSAIHPDRSVLIPCLHDESYAHLSFCREMFCHVRGVAFYTGAELRLAQRLYEMRPDAAALVRGGVDTDFEFNARRFVAKYGVEAFLLYVGRKEGGKNVPLLVDYFAQYKRHHGGDLKLVLVGKGSVEVPSDCRREILDLGFVSEQDKRDAYAAAVALCQPSLNESFSIVMMEAWLAGTPALVHADCEVTRDHCVEANGGLFFADSKEFAETVEWLRAEPARRRTLGAQGRHYVLRHYSWDSVVENYMEAFERWGFELQPRHRPLRAVTEPQKQRSEAHQLLAGFRAGDAISQSAVTIQATLRSWGFASEIFAEHISTNSLGSAWSVEELYGTLHEGQLLIYHYSIHSEGSEIFLRHPGRKILIYHNITPPHFFAGYSEVHVSLARSGRDRLSELIRAAHMCMADSRYNCLELEEHGATDCRVLPIPQDLERLGRTEPDPEVMRRFGNNQPTFLFVGRLVPCKRQDDVIRVFAHYRKLFNRKARLVLVGGFGPDRFATELLSLTRDMGLDGKVTFADHASDHELAAYYQMADAFVSMSEHEGFCVPLIEAMYFGVPIVAYAAAAVPFTLGNAGVLVKEKDFSKTAEVLHRVIRERQFKDQIIAGQRRRLKDFSLQKTTAMLKLYLEELVGDIGEMSATS